MMWIVMTSSAKMPSSVKAAYTRVALVRLSQEYTAHDMRPKMISTHARGVERVVNVGSFPAKGKTPRSGIVRALAAAEAEAYRLNNAAEPAKAEEIITFGGSA